jgi:DNA processing protein
MYDDLFYRIALTTIPGIGAVQAKILVDHFQEAQNVFKAKESTLEKIEGIGPVRARNIKEFENFAAVESEIEFIERYKIQALFLTDQQYPQRLLNCYDAPTMLYYRGNADLNNSKIISIIGTRNNTEYGREVTEQLVQDLESFKVIIVSGLAYGIDIIAHKAALQHNLQTVGVLAHGLDKIYPKLHLVTAKQMTMYGGLLTEFPRGTLPDKHNFPRRNRIVAGMADATVVVETAVKGGSIITAELAEGYNRDVFAFPGRVHDAKSAGCNYLIRNSKATLLSKAEELVEWLGWQEKKPKRKRQKELFVTLTPDEQLLVDILKEKETVHIDELNLKSGLTSSTVAGALLSLEFQTLISSLPGKLYKLL